MIIQLSFLFHRISEFELKTSLSNFTLESKQEVEELRMICEDALQSLEKMEVKYRLNISQQIFCAVCLNRCNSSLKTAYDEQAMNNDAQLDIIDT